MPQGKKEYKKQTKDNQEADNPKTNENKLVDTNKKTNKKDNTPKFTLSKENHQAIVYELDQEVKPQKSKQYTKRNKH